jgi:signal transduction histidine kinase
VYDEARRMADLRRPRFFHPTGEGFGNDVPFDPATLGPGLRGQAQYSTTVLRGERIRVYTQPLYRNGQLDGAVQIARELREVEQLVGTQTRLLIFFLPLAVVAAAIGALVLTNRALKPVAAVTQAAAAISHTDLSRRLDVVGEDELAQLSQTFNEMLGRLERSFGELQTAYSSLESAYQVQRRLTADASHELRTPLTRLRLATSASLRNATSEEELKAALQTADRAAESMARLVDQLLTLARADAGQLGLVCEPVDLRVVVAEAMEVSAGDDPRVEGDFADRAVMVNADPSHLKRVVINLVDNALRHTPPEGRVEVWVGVTGSEAYVTVSDTGEGIPAEALPRVFERFYRVDVARDRREGGSGLGLAICKEIVEAHGGRIVLESKRGSGTTAQVFLPVFSPTRLSK